ncbi:hypothetical protein ACFOPQ_01345 [Deinococcus antarcticus]|uniref:Uncharacterized protein n=1 Tax=Deinococcus antarcticus TaxID=1298767 RepID=A0ABV8A575_9DEIO
MILLQPRDPKRSLLKLTSDVPTPMRRDILRVVTDAYHRVYRDVQTLPLGLRKDEFGRRLRTEISAGLHMMGDRAEYTVRRRIVKVPRGSAHFVLLRTGTTFLVPANTKRVSGVPRPSLYMTVLNEAAAPDLEDLDIRLSPLNEDLPVVVQYGHAYPTDNVPMDPIFVRLSALSSDGRSYVCAIDLVAEFVYGQPGTPVAVEPKGRKTHRVSSDEMPILPVKVARGHEDTKPTAVGDGSDELPSMRVVKRKKGE